MKKHSRLIYGEWDGATAAERAELDARLAADPTLGAELRRARQLRADLRSLASVDAAPPPLDFARLAAGAPPARRDHRWLAAAAAVLACAGGWWALGGSQPADVPLADAPAPASATPVEPTPAARDEAIEVAFSLRAPTARAVTVAGDFNDWQAETLTMSRTEDGLWTAQTALPPGRYAYMYVVDGRWMTPPDARRTQDDGFGARNGVLDLLAPSDA